MTISNPEVQMSESSPDKSCSWTGVPGINRHKALLSNLFRIVTGKLAHCESAG